MLTFYPTVHFAVQQVRQSVSFSGQHCLVQSGSVCGKVHFAWQQLLYVTFFQVRSKQHMLIYTTQTVSLKLNGNLNILDDEIYQQQYHAHFNRQQQHCYLRVWLVLPCLRSLPISFWRQKKIQNCSLFFLLLSTLKKPFPICVKGQLKLTPFDKKYCMNIDL